MLSPDLAQLYEVAPKVLVQSVKRNIGRFPPDFMFRLNPKEMESLRSQIVTLEKGRGRYAKYPPYGFTEHGIAMLSSVLRSERAVRVNIEIVRTFVRLRRALASNAELARKLKQVEKKCSDRHGLVLKDIRKLILPDPDAPPVKIRLVK